MGKAAKKNITAHSELGWPEGDYYVPGFSSDGHTSLVPGAADTHRRLFLIRAARLEPEIQESLRKIPNDEAHLRAWAGFWHLNDRWCWRLARDALLSWRTDREVKGWPFEQTITTAAFYPFRIEPLTFEPFYYDPTWRRRGQFKRDTLQRVAESIEAYCDRVEAEAEAAGLKRAPRRIEPVHFDWLVRYQILSESCGAIAGRTTYRFKGGRQTVHKAVSELAKYLNLTLRASTSKRARRS